MDKFKKNNRGIKFFSAKNGIMMIAHSENIKRYAESLEMRGDVSRYRICERLDIGVFDRIDPIDIRSEYFDCESGGSLWETDIWIEYENGTRAVREIVNQYSLSKRATIEQLELSRRYWAALGVSDWRIVLFEVQEVERDNEYVF